MKMNIILWGTGERAEQFLKRDYFQSCNILGFADTYKNKDCFMGYKVYMPDELPQIMVNTDYLIIANQFFGENLELCMELGIEWDKIVITDNVQAPVYRKKFLKLKDISEELFRLLEDRQFRLVKINEADEKDSGRIFGKGKYGCPLYMDDYFRYRTFELAARQILENRVDGETAELGVFRGTFAAFINETFKERKLYLFDTFEGFQEEEARKEMRMGRCSENFVTGHKDTSVERMLSNMPHPEKCTVCQGFFPESVTDKVSAEKFAFVSIDVDLEESTYQGLRFFYPRLSEGGMIFLHDYHTFYLEGVKVAVSRFENDFEIVLKKLPLADRAGTLVIIK